MERKGRFFVGKSSGAGEIGFTILEKGIMHEKWKEDVKGIGIDLLYVDLGNGYYTLSIGSI